MEDRDIPLRPPELDLPPEFTHSKSSGRVEDSRQPKALQAIVLALLRMHSISDELLGTIWSFILEFDKNNSLTFRAGDPADLNRALPTSATLNTKILEILTKMLASLTAARTEQDLAHSVISEELKSGPEGSNSSVGNMCDLLFQLT